MFHNPTSNTKNAITDVQSLCWKLQKQLRGGIPRKKRITWLNICFPNYSTLFVNEEKPWILRAYLKLKLGFPGGSVVKESACQSRRHGLGPWSEKMPHTTEQLKPVGPKLQSHVPYNSTRRGACSVVPNSLRFQGQALLSMGLSRQEYWSGFLFPSPGHLPNPETEPRSPCIVGRFFTSWATSEAQEYWSG